MTVQKNDKKYLGRDTKADKIVVTKSDGSYVYDQEGNKYIDFHMGWCVGNIGWSVKDVVKRIQKFNGPTYVNPNYMYEGWSELAELLAEITPSKLTKSFRATGGTEAVEIALQAAMAHTKRTGFVSIEGSYHGHSIGTMSVGASFFRDWYSNLLPDCHKIEAPLDEAAARKVEKILSTRKIAAFISEPVICNRAVIIPEQKFFDIVQAACKKYGTLFIVDEVATGFGRTGKMFGSEHYNLKPDIMCMAKGMSGGFGAIGATIMTKEVAKSFEFDFSFYSTYGWHPLNTEATIANIKYLKKNKEKLFANAEKLSPYIEERLRAMKFKKQPEIRVKGLTVGVEFGEEGYSQKIITKAFKKGLLLTPVTETNFVIFPPLTMSMKTVKEGLDILESCL